MLALKILGSSPQSANQERIFKGFARQQTAVRNRMRNETMVNLAIVKSAYQAKKTSKQIAAGNGPEKYTNRIIIAAEHPRVDGGAVIIVDEVEDEVSVVEDEEVMKEGTVVNFWRLALHRQEESQTENDDNDDDSEALPPMNARVFGNTSDFSPNHNVTVQESFHHLCHHKMTKTIPRRFIKVTKLRAAEFSLFDLFGYEGNDTGHHPVLFIYFLCQEPSRSLISLP